MAAEVQPGQREEVELEEGGRLTRVRLDRAKITEYGWEVLGGKAVIVHMPALEGKVFNVDCSDDDLIIPNPDQPRKNFKPEKMTELEGTIEAIGQKQAINTAPIVFKDDSGNPSGKRALFIIDGERRDRSVKRLGKARKVVVDWVRDEGELLYGPLVLNETHEDHTPMERAFYYRTLIEYETRMGDSHPRRTVAKKVGASAVTLNKHLDYLDYLSPELQEMLDEGRITPNNADKIVEKKKQFGDKLDLDIVATLIRSRKGPVDFVINASIQEALRRSGHEVEAAKDEIAAAITKFVSSLEGISHATEIVLGADTKIVVDRLFGCETKNKTLDTVRDLIEEVRTNLAKLAELITQTIEPLPLEKIPGKPSFSNYVTRRQDKFGSDARVKIALVLAQAADEHGKFMTSDELVQRCGIESSAFANNIRLLPAELTKMGLELQHCLLRRKNSCGQYAKKTAYRLAWLKEEPAGRGMTKEERIAALKAANERARQRLEQRGSRNRAGHEDDEDGVPRQEDNMPLKHFDIAVSAPESEPALLNAAQKIAQNIQGIESRGTVRGGTEFGNRLGVKIEILMKRGEKIYLVKSNVRGFSLNFQLSARVFRDFIAEALHTEQNTIRVDVQDL